MDLKVTFSVRSFNFKFSDMGKGLAGEGMTLNLWTFCNIKPNNKLIKLYNASFKINK